MGREEAKRYAEAVADVLAGEFIDVEDEGVRSLVTRTVVAHAVTPTRVEVIVDSPRTANWRLKDDHERPGRVRVACYKFRPTDIDDEREDRINRMLWRTER